MERDLERQCCEIARGEFDAVSVKLDNAARGWPDRLFVLPGRRAVFVEFKTDKGVVKPQQALIHRYLEQRGFRVYVVRRVGQIRKIFCELP